jgi:two-component system, response regulator, stage 0 sporulation protein F
MPIAAALPPAVLVVDDHPGVLAMLHRVLREFVVTYEIVPFEDGETALAHLTERTVPLVFTDYHMPMMTGLELTSALKAVAPDTRVVMITAYDTAELRRRARATGVDYFLPKPFSFDELEAIVHAVLT